MVRIGNIEVSKASLAFRIFGGFFLAGLVLFLFYYLPSHLTSVLSPYVPSQYIPYASQIVSIIVNSPIPLLGILLAVSVFFDVLLRGSWLYGIVLIVTGMLFVSYDFFLFRSGQLVSDIFPTQSLGGTSSSFLSQLNLIVLILMIPTFISIARGFSMVIGRNHVR